MVNIIHRATLPPRKTTLYTLHRKLGGPQSRPGRFRKEKNLLLLLGFEPRTSTPVAWLLFRLCYTGSCFSGLQTGNVFITYNRVGTLYWQKDGFLPGNLLTEKWGEQTDCAVVHASSLMAKTCWKGSYCPLAVFYITRCIPVCRFGASGDETLRKQAVKWTEGWQAFIYNINGS
jgi:hypothetical protein